MMTAISNYVAQNFGAGKSDRIRQGVRACLIQTETLNLIMCVGILLLRHPIVQMFLSDPTKEIYHYSDMYLTVVAPFYFIHLAVYRTSIQSKNRLFFFACMIELVMRIAATVGLSGMIGYTSVCIASPLMESLLPAAYKMMLNCLFFCRLLGVFCCYEIFICYSFIQFTGIFEDVFQEFKTLFFEDFCFCKL